MTIERISINNFQSLKKIDIELGRFTVITGASSSGKSAFLRAVRGLASYVRGSSAITVGEKSMSVSAYTDSHIVTLQRTGATGKYVITDRSSGKEEKYSKLAQKVPEDVTEALKILPVGKEQGSINFAGQHDMPYLLNDSSAQVARVLGDLTKVSTIFEAVREANKKKTAINSLLKTRQTDFDAIVLEAGTFSYLKDKVALFTVLESTIGELSTLEEKISQLAPILEELEKAQNMLSLGSVPTEKISLSEVESLYSELTEYKNLLSSLALGQKELKNSTVALTSCRNEELSANESLHSRLAELGLCPTCGQTID